MSRVTRAYVSDYQRARIHRSVLVRGEVRPLVAVLSGAMPKDTTVETVTWRCDNPWMARMSNARIDGTETAVDLVAQYGCRTAVKCEATLSDGRVLTQLFEVVVEDSPWFQGEPSAPVSGPYSLTVNADLPDEGPPP